MHAIQSERSYNSKYPLDELFNRDYWKIIFVNTMLNNFPFEKEDIKKIGYRKLCNNSNIAWPIEGIYQFTINTNNSADAHLIIENNKILWDEYLLESARMPYWIYDTISKISNFKWTNSFIIKYKDEFNWEELTLNPSIVWNEDLLFQVEEYVDWRLLIGNPNVRWTKKIIERVIQALDEAHVYAVGYTFYEKYVHIALSKGFRPFNTINIYENALQYLKQFQISHSSEKFNKVVWNALSENPEIPWTIDDLEKHGTIDICKIIKYAKKLPLRYKDFAYIKRINEYADIFAADLDDESFWNPANIKELALSCDLKSGGKAYLFDDISRNNSVKWNQELFLFVRDNNYDGNFEELTKKEKFFSYLVDTYGREELRRYFMEIYDYINKLFWFEYKTDSIHVGDEVS